MTMLVSLRIRTKCDMRCSREAGGGSRESSQLLRHRWETWLGNVYDFGTYCSGLTYYSCIHYFGSLDDIIDSRVPAAEPGYGSNQG